MKVAQLCTRFPPGPGGVEQHVAEVAPRLHARGHTVDVYTSDLYREFPAMQRLPPGVPREEKLPWGNVHRLPVWSLPGELHYVFFRNLTETLARDRPEIVHAHTYGTYQVTAAHRHHRRYGTPFVLTAHFHPIWSIEGGWMRRRLRGFYDRRIAGGVVQDAARIIVQTHEEERLLRELGLPLPPLEIIPPGYRPLPPPPPGERPFSGRFRVGGPFVLFVGRLASNKGLLDLAPAFAKLAASDPTAQLVVIGEDGGQRAAFTAAAAQLGMADRVHLLGHLEDESLLSAAFREARVTVLPSEYEAFGLVLLESLAAATPVVASRVGGIPEVVEDGKAGLLVPPRSPAELAEALGRIWADPDLAHRMGEYGRDHVVPRFSWDALVDRLDALYREVVGR